MENKKQKQVVQRQKPNPMAQLAPIRENLPLVVSNYSLAIWRVTFLSLLIYISVSVVLSVKSDLFSKLTNENEILLSKINQCSKDYFDNYCDGKRVPAIEK